MEVTAYGPKIFYIIVGKHNTIVDATSQLEHDPSINQTAESYYTMKVKMNPKRVQKQTGCQSQKRCELKLEDTINIKT
jgi:hypothetical protein